MAASYAQRKMRFFKGALLRFPLLVPVAIGLLISVVGLTAADTITGGRASGGYNVFVSGQLDYHTLGSEVAVVGAAEPAGFTAVAFGRSFTATVSGLGPGQYTVEIDAAETVHRQAGLRVMDVSCGATRLARSLDLFQAAGGFAKAHRLQGTVDHSDDAIGGPLTIRFTGRKDTATFCALRVKNAAGEVVASVTAAQLQAQEPPGADRIPDVRELAIYTDPSQPRTKRINDLIRRMSLREKVGQMLNAAPAIERLGVPAYDYWNECLHGVARAGTATVFPQAIGLAAMWDDRRLHAIAEVIATEARAKYHDAIRLGNHGRYYGLTFWTPNINLFRDPRWGRGQETYGEDPFLTGRLAVAFITGLQGDDPRYAKALACAKHFAVHSGPEPERHSFDAAPPEEDFYDSYLPQFEAAVREGHVGSVMGAYNRVYGEPACSNPRLLTELLRHQWGFDGHVVSDCSAINDIWAHHKVVATPEEAAARAVKAGCDLECGNQYAALTRAVARGLLTEQDLDQALRHIFDARFRLGMFDPDSAVPYAQIPRSEVDSSAHAALALDAARASIVLLKNSGVLPLDRTKVKRLAVIGANADSVPMLLGNYNGTPSRPVTILRGLQTAAEKAGITVNHARGCPLVLKAGETFAVDSAEFLQVLDAVRDADAIVYAGGISPQLEGEEMKVNDDGFRGGDRTRIELPAVQTALLKVLQATGKPVIFVNCSGSAIAMPWEADNLAAILQAWYPGQAGGTAVAEIIFGDCNPSGRLPVTFYRATDDLPPFVEYAMANRTYRFFSGKPLFAFGHGLSYARFRYDDVRLTRTEFTVDEAVSFTLAVANVGDRDGEEVVQVYGRRVNATDARSPRHVLCAFRRVTVPKGQRVVIELTVPPQTLRHWDAASKSYVVDPGTYELQIGAASDDIRTAALVRFKANR